MVFFIDYLCKWVEVFLAKDQTALTIARLLVELDISRHGVPRELLSDRGAAFLSSLLKDMSKLMGLHKVFTTAYHPQRDGLVEKFNCTLTNTLAKTVEKSGRNWDKCLPYVLFAYRTSVQESTQESPFHFLYERDPYLPSEDALCAPALQEQFDIGSYQEELVIHLQAARELARGHIRKAEERQKKQKKNYGKGSQPISLKVGDRVYLHVPSAKKSKAYKFAWPFKGLYRVLALYNNGADIRLIDCPREEPKSVVINRLRRCPREVGLRNRGKQATEDYPRELDTSDGDNEDELQMQKV